MFALDAAAAMARRGRVSKLNTVPVLLVWTPNWLGRALP